MSKEVWRFELKLELRQTIEMPAGSTILCAGLQRHHPQVWAEVHPTAEEEDRHLLFIATGYPMPETKFPPLYVGTLWCPVHSSGRDGSCFVYHVYEEVDV